MVQSQGVCVYAVLGAGGGGGGRVLWKGSVLLQRVTHRVGR